MLPPADDELARAATEFDTLEELRADIEQRIRAQLDLEIESAFRTAVADALVDAANVDAARPARRGPGPRSSSAASSARSPAAGSAPTPTSS